jgi:acyl carrier protein
MKSSEKYIRKLVLELVANVAEMPKVKEEHRFKEDLHFDSLDVSELAVELENELSLDIDLDVNRDDVYNRVMKNGTVGDLITVIIDGGKK